MCLAERERFSDVRVDVTASEGLFGIVEIHRAVDFDHDVSVSRVWQEVDSDEIRADRTGSIDRERSRRLWWA